MLVNGDLPLSRQQRRDYITHIRAQLATHDPTRKAAPLPRLRSAEAPRAAQGDSPLRIYNDERLRRALAPLAGRRLSILDVGCGRGHYVDFFRQAGIEGEYLGIDAHPRPDWDRHATASGALTVRYQAGPIEDCPLPEGEADFVLSSSALEHFADDRLAARRLFAATRPGGLGLHMVPGLASHLLYGYHGYRRYDEAGLSALFTDAGFEVLGAERQGGPASFLVHVLWIGICESGHFRQIVHDMLRDGGPDDAWRRRLVGPWFPGMRQGRRLVLYRWLVLAALALDHILPSRLTCGHAVLVRRPQGGAVGG
jgi:SAM-dependent methyltransferase